MAQDVKWRERKFDDGDRLADALAERVAANLRQAFAARAHASLVVSGGRSPVPLFRRLARSNLEWSAVTVTLADERWVPVESEDSNEGLVRRNLLQDKASSACLVGLYGGETSPEAGEAACARRLAGVPRPFDTVVLGMGEDGHTASFFPGSSDLSLALAGDERPCKAIHAANLAQPRMTLTLPTLLDARCIVLSFQGAAKRRVYETALRSGPVEDLPVRAILHQDRTPVEVFWSP